MNILVINSGSSSIKYQLFRMPGGQSVSSGLVERIGLEHSVIIHKTHRDGKETVMEKSTAIADHRAGLIEVSKLLTDPETGVIRNPDEIGVVGHRVVHGGESFAATTIITEAVKKEIRRLFSLAPLHNPPNYLGIEVAEQLFIRATQVAVFDTAFHQTMPEKAFRYAIPQEFYHQHRIRAYGFHGTSHKYVSEKAAQYLGNPQAKIITIHIGNGCSMTAVDAGKSVDTSMGFGPMNGLVMGTRSGDIDQSLIFYLVNQLGYDLNEVSTLLNKRSGMLGLTGFSDMRDIGKAIAEGDSQAKLAREMYAYRIKKYIGAYAAILNGLDALVFTAGVGENDASIRALACKDLHFLGIAIDDALNQQPSREIRAISPAGSRVQALVIPTNEELEIARQCYGLLTADASGN